MEKNIIEYKIFYSWQSDCDEKINKIYIKQQLDLAINEIKKNKKGKIKIDYDEATRNTSGSHNIKETLFRKIDECDYFIADVTPVINLYKYLGITKMNSKVISRLLNLFDFKAVSNSNVMFELGYAVNKLGWDRIILVWNQFYGKVENAPFDIRGHATLTYNYSLTCEDSKLKQKLINEISKLIKYKPLKLTKNDLNIDDDSTKIKRERDIENLNYLLANVDFTSLNQIFSNGMNFIPDDILTFWEFFNAIISDFNFSFYDSKLKSLVIEIHKLWDSILSFPQYYDLDKNGNIKMRTDSQSFNIEKYQEFQEIINQNIPKLQHAVENFFELIKEEYMEININDKKMEARKNLVEN
ncbi:hypothetical protein [Acinetobacter bereziniae]|uniref:hypothetical protein n=1 Tax=Acinetobacter bereziniae TaxID=106648 RepID=UPI00357103B4